MTEQELEQICDKCFNTDCLKCDDYKVYVISNYGEKEWELELKASEEYDEFR